MNPQPRSTPNPTGSERRRSPFGITLSRQSPAESLDDRIKQKGLTPFQAKEVLAGNKDALLIGNYVIEHLLGSGPWGECYQAVDLISGASVSLRKLPISLHDEQGQLAQSMQLVGRIVSPSLQTPVQTGMHYHQSYLVHQFCRGENLERVVDRVGRLLPLQAVECLLQAVDALSVAQAAGVMHGELRPSRLVVNRQGMLSILEIATANFIRKRRQADAKLATLIKAMPVDHVRCTAPEMYSPKQRVGFQADIYSLGCILHLLLTGRHVFVHPDAGQTVLAHRSSSPPKIASRRFGISTKFDTLLRRMLAKSPGDRFTSYGQLRETLESLRGELEATTLTASRSWEFINENWVNTPRPVASPWKKYVPQRWLATVAVTLLAVALICLVGWRFFRAGDSTTQPLAADQTTRGEDLQGTPPEDDLTAGPREVITVEAENVFQLP